MKCLLKVLIYCFYSCLLTSSVSAGDLDWTTIKAVSEAKYSVNPGRSETVSIRGQSVNFSGIYSARAEAMSAKKLEFLSKAAEIIQRIKTARRVRELLIIKADKLRDLYGGNAVEALSAYIDSEIEIATQLGKEEQATMELESLIGTAGIAVPMDDGHQDAIKRANVWPDNTQTQDASYDPAENHKEVKTE